MMQFYLLRRDENNDDSIYNIKLDYWRAVWSKSGSRWPWMLALCFLSNRNLFDFPVMRFASYGLLAAVHTIFDKVTQLAIGISRIWSTLQISP
jgi:hypothetical protein